MENYQFFYDFFQKIFTGTVDKPAKRDLKFLKDWLMAS